MRTLSIYLLFLFWDTTSSVHITDVQAGGFHTCALFDDGNVKCWGYNFHGELGLGTLDYTTGLVGDAQPFINFGAVRSALQIAVGTHFTCVLLDNKQVKCFGSNEGGKLGYDDSITDLGGNPFDMGDNLTYVDLGPGRTAKSISAGSQHACVILDNDQVKCWGVVYDNANGVCDNLTYVSHSDGNPTDIKISNSYYSPNATCVLLNSTLACFGFNEHGQLGIPASTSSHVKCNDSKPIVDLGTNLTVKQVATAGRHTCALLSNDQVKCFGDFRGLGIGATVNIPQQQGDMGDNLPFVELGNGYTVLQVAAANGVTCAILDNWRMKCWGDGGYLGLEDNIDRGQGGTMGDNLPFVNFGIGRTVTKVSVGWEHTCVLLDNQQVKCFGENGGGQLGISVLDELGDEKGEMGDNLPYVILTNVVIGSSCVQDNHCTSGFCRERCCSIVDDNCASCTTNGTCGDCDTAYFLNQNSQCSPKSLTGSSCATANECASGICIGNVCRTESDPNCIQCGENGKCVACADGFQLETDAACSNFLDENLLTFALVGGLAGMMLLSSGALLMYRRLNRFKKGQIMLSFRGESGRYKQNLKDVQALQNQLNTLAKRDGVAYMANNDAPSKSDIVAAVKRAGAVVAILTDDYFESEWCVAELVLAVKMGKKVAVVYWEDDPESNAFHQRLVDDRMFAYEQVNLEPKTLEKFELETNDLDLAARALRDILHIGIKLFPAVQLEATVKELLQRGLGYRLPKSRFSPRRGTDKLKNRDAEVVENEGV